MLADLRLSLHTDGTTGTLTPVEDDVTVISEADIDLREGHSDLAVQAAPVAVYEVDLDLRVIRWNPAAEQLFGWTAAEVLGSPIPYLTDDTRQDVERMARRVLSGEAVSNVRVQRLRRDGAWIEIVLSIAPVRAANGEVTSALAVAMDATELALGEAMLRGQSEVLELIALDAPLTETLDSIARLVEEQGAGLCSVLILRDDLTVESAAGPSLPKEFTAAIDGASIGPKAGSCGTAAWRREPVFVEDIEQDPLWEDWRELALGFGLRSCWSVPLLATGGNRVLGTFAIYHGVPALPTFHDRRLLDLSTKLAVIAIERTSERERLAHQALHDPLTALPNRSLFLERLELALAGPDPHVAVLFCDVDRFKVVNDSLGHDAGDRLLVTLAERLRGASRVGDIVARLGGDEFTVLCEGISDVAEAEIMAARLADAVAEPFELEGVDDAVVTASIGIALAESGAEAKDVLANADAAMYRAKQAGRNRVVVFDEHMRQETLERLHLESDLRRAVAKGELVLHFQPEVDLRDGTTRAWEALVRWDHPYRGLLFPGQFLPIAEQAGLLPALGEWVLREACMQAARWLGASAPAPTVWVNVHAQQLAQPDLVEVVDAALGAAGIAPELLCLEITESALMSDAAVSLNALNELRRIGVRLAIDDFGTGYSSLSYLRRFPVDYIKIDRTFIDGLGVDPEDSAIVAAIIAMGDSLGRTVVAEGVETELQRTELLRLGCVVGQGYLFARPAPATAIT
jgi:diguanylate cyclase (GGDEF)-like protein/PAS domain S-box-containing protein